MDLYRGASADAGVENEDKKGVLSDNEKVTILSKCEDYYYIIRTDGSNDKGFTRKENLRVLVKDVKVQEQNVSIELGGSRTLTTKVTPDFADISGLSWKSGDSAIVSVDDSGTVKGISEGTTDVSVASKDGSNSTGTTYDVTAAHELGHILGLDDAYYDEYDRCADNSETGHKYRKGKYDNLMKDHQFYTKINANSIEMMLQAVDPNTGMPDFASQCFKSYGDETISDVIKNHKDYQRDHD